MSPAHPAPGWPLYAHPLTEPAAWERATQMAGSWSCWGDGLIVVNVFNGPGSEADADGYQPALDRLREAAPAECLAGYVHTTWGRRPASPVHADARTWRDRHGLRALMLDEFCCGTEPAADVDASVALLEELRPEWDRLVVNAGCPITQQLAERLEGLVDAVCTGERSRRERPIPQRRGPLPAGALRWELVHSAPSGTGARDVAGADLAWCTSASLPHPWDGTGSSPLA